MLDSCLQIVRQKNKHLAYVLNLLADLGRIQKPKVEQRPFFLTEVDARSMYLHHLQRLANLTMMVKELNEQFAAFVSSGSSSSRKRQVRPPLLLRDQQENREIMRSRRKSTTHTHIIRNVLGLVCRLQMEAMY